MSEGLRAHLSDEDINEYRRRTLAPAELIIADDHLASCDACYRRVSRADEVNIFVDAAETLVQSRSESDHLSYDQLASYIDGNHEDVDREICDVHLQICKRCSEDLRDLNIFKISMSEADREEGSSSAPSVPEKISFWRRLHWTPLRLAGAATLAALLIGAVVWSIYLIAQSRRVEVARSDQPAIVSPSPASSIERPNPSPSPLASPEILIALNDGGGQVRLDKTGQLEGIDDLPSSYQQAIKTALSTGHLNLAPELEDLSKEPSVLMGGKADGVSFGLLSPIGTVIRTTRPVFRWKALEGANSYVVNVYNTRFNKVASSPRLMETHWALTSSLDPGALYIWQVTANKDGAEIKSPVQPAPEARFKVLDQFKADELDRVKRAHPSSHLVLGTLYAQAGLLEDAQKEFQALYSANPKSDVVQKLLRQVAR